EGDLGELLAGAEAVEHLAAGEPALPQLRVDAAAEVLTQVRARAPGGLVDREVGRGGERRRDAAEACAARAVRPQVRPEVGQGTSTTLPTVLRSASFASACGAWSSGRVSPTSGSTAPDSTSVTSSSWT